MNTQPNALQDEGSFLGEIEVNPTSRRIARPDGSAKIEPKAMQVLLGLVRSAGRVVTRQQLGRIEDAARDAEELNTFARNFSMKRKQFAFPHKDRSL